MYLTESPILQLAIAFLSFMRLNGIVPAFRYIPIPIPISLNSLRWLERVLPYCLSEADGRFIILRMYYIRLTSLRGCTYIVLNFSHSQKVSLRANFMREFNTIIGLVFGDSMSVLKI